MKAPNALLAQFITPVTFVRNEDCESLFITEIPRIKPFVFTKGGQRKEHDWRCVGTYAPLNLPAVTLSSHLSTACSHL